MDSLRTQKVRFLTGFYNKMKMTTTKNSRLALIEDIENIIDRSKNQKIVVEVRTKNNYIQNLNIRLQVIFNHQYNHPYISSFCENCSITFYCSIIIINCSISSITNTEH